MFDVVAAQDEEACGAAPIISVSTTASRRVATPLTTPGTPKRRAARPARPTSAEHKQKRAEITRDVDDIHERHILLRLTLNRRLKREKFARQKDSRAVKRALKSSGAACARLGLIFRIRRTSMNLTDIPLLECCASAWLAQRAPEDVLSQNVANADTPGYTARDLKPLDFENVLKKSQETQSTDSASGLAVDRSASHRDPAAERSTTFTGLSTRRTSNANPTGNSVSLEEEMIKVADTQAQYPGRDAISIAKRCRHDAHRHRHAVQLRRTNMDLHDFHAGRGVGHARAVRRACARSRRTSPTPIRPRPSRAAIPTAARSRRCTASSTAS